MKKNSILKNFFQVSIKGVFWLLPIVAIVIVILWLFNKVDIFVNFVFRIIGFTPFTYEALWFILVIVVLLIFLYIIGHFMETKLASFFEEYIAKIPGYSTIKDIIGIFNSSKDGQNKVLVVIIKGFASQGYNIGLMYSTQQSIIKDHYTVTLSQTPIPNGGYLFEVHKNNIFVIQEASFDDNLQYLLSMGVKSLADIIDTKPKDINDFISLEKYLKEQK